MKIAVTYDNGNVFQHFGRTENFKIYEVKDGMIIDEQVIGNEGFGHESLAGYLRSIGVDLLICGGMGPGAQAALADAGITVFSGAEGNADEAVIAFLKGELQSTGVNCDHHHHEEEGGCGEGCAEGDCGGDCGSGCGGCCGGAPQIILEGPNAGKTVRVHYRGTFNDGTQFDSSYDRNQPLEFICGAGMMIRGFDKAVVEMKQGEIKDVHLMPEEAYGLADPNMIFSFPIKNLPGSEGLNVGERVFLADSTGQQFPVTVTAKDEENITLDANHELAGKELNFRIELVEIL